jgi:hypothetical protein
MQAAAVVASITMAIRQTKVLRVRVALEAVALDRVTGLVHRVRPTEVVAVAVAAV